MNTGWKYTADDSVLEFVTDPALSRSALRRLKDVFRRIAEHPTQPAAFLGHDSAGRRLNVVTEGEFEVVYWVDHAAKEVRITSVFRD